MKKKLTKRELRIQTKLTLEGLVPFAIAGILFGLLYNSLFYPHTFVEYVEAGTIGLLLGLVSGIAEQTFLQRWIYQRSFSQTLLIRTILYAIFVAISLSLVLSIEPAALGECLYGGCLADYLMGPLFLRDLVFSTIFVFFITFFVQVILLIGIRNFRRMILGKYRQPRELYAVFMFVDIRSSTTIAEKLGHEKFSAFLRDFFNDISGAIYEAKGEIYQYVGDEVIIVWPEGQAAKDSYWLSCYESMCATLEKMAPVYMESYGAIPEFKAGVHDGLVITTEVGTLQRAHVYHGDVLNTAARIQAKCNEEGYDLLVSESLVSAIRLGRRKEFDKVGTVLLRGKSEGVVIYGFDKQIGQAEIKGSVSA